VLSDGGSGATSDVISGINFAFEQHSRNPATPAIATMSLGGTINCALDYAIKAAIAGGLHFTVAAGNNNMPASLASPANIEGANTIGAVDSSDRRASFSNYGGMVDVWAPRVEIKSAWFRSWDAERTISSTSAAT
ncbi:subtilisin-like protein, partial [Ceratobasidium sp. AG-I]